MKHLVACFLVIIGAMAAHSARADFTLNYGVLTCDGTRALIRFAIAPNYDAPAFPDPPDEIDFGLSALPRVDGNVCILSDGREVKVKMGDRQPFPYGMCGGRNDASMSLWVDGRKVISRHEVTFSCVANRRGEVIVVNDRQLTICQSFATEGAIDYEAPAQFECNDATQMLEIAEPDAIEYPGEGEKQPALGSMTIPFAESISFCQGFIGSEPKPKSEDLWRWQVLMVASAIDAYHQEGAMRIVPPEALRGPTFEAPGFHFPDLIDDQPEFETVGGTSTRFSPPYWSMARLNFDNDGDDDTVLINSFRSGSFDGDVVQITTDDEDNALADALRSYRETAETASLRPLMELFEKFAIVEYSGHFERMSLGYAERHTYQHIFRVNGETLVFAAPNYQRRRPTAIIYRPRPNGEAEPVCIFQRIEENY